MRTAKILFRVNIIHGQEKTECQILELRRRSILVLLHTVKKYIYLRKLKV